MPNYTAQLNEDLVCECVTETLELISAPPERMFIVLEGFDATLVDKKYQASSKTFSERRQIRSGGWGGSSTIR